MTPAVISTKFCSPLDIFWIHRSIFTNLIRARLRPLVFIWAYLNSASIYSMWIDIIIISLPLHQPYSYIHMHLVLWFLLCIQYTMIDNDVLSKINYSTVPRFLIDPHLHKTKASRFNLVAYLLFSSYIRYSIVNTWPLLLCLDHNQKTFMNTTISD